MDYFTLVNKRLLGWVRQFLCLLEIYPDFLKSVEWAASRPSYIQGREKALTIVLKEKR